MFVILWRSVFLYTLAIALLRFMGKRQIGELQPSELVTTVMISNIAAIPIENPDSPLLGGVLPIAALACLEVLSAAAALKSSRLRAVLMGRPRWLIRGGVIDQREMRAMRWTTDDLCAQLRAAGVFDLSDAEAAVAETNGSLSVLQKHAARPPSSEELGLAKPRCTAPPDLVISDGEVRAEALAACGLTEQALTDILAAEHAEAEEVFLLLCDRGGRYTLIRKDPP